MKERAAYTRKVPCNNPSSRNSRSFPPSPLRDAVLLVGRRKVAEACGVGQAAVLRWESNACLPRTDFTGETDYAERISRATNFAFSAKLLRERPAKSSPGNSGITMTPL